MRPLARRGLLAGLLAAPAIRAQAPFRLVVIGGGFAGSAAARALAARLPAAAITHITGAPAYFAPPLSNAAIAGLRPPERQVFTHAPRAGIELLPLPATAIDPDARLVRLANGLTRPYDRLILAPGIAPIWNAIHGYDEAASRRMPHAWDGAAQADLLRTRFAALPKGATIVIGIPAAPYRCPPAPYERASLLAHALQSSGRGGKILLLDAKDQFSQQAQFRQAWAERYPGLIEWIGLSDGGSVTAVDAATGRIETDFGTYTPDLATIIPPQRAAPIAAIAADRTGWCPVNPDTFESTLHPRIHVIGDAALLGQMSKSASGAVSQAAHLAAILAGQSTTAPRLASACTSTVAPDWGFAIANTYHVQDGLLAEDPGGGGSPLDAPPEARAHYAAEAETWFTRITDDCFR